MSDEGLRALERLDREGLVDPELVAAARRRHARRPLQLRDLQGSGELAVRARLAALVPGPNGRAAAPLGVLRAVERDLAVPLDLVPLGDQVGLLFGGSLLVFSPASGRVHLFNAREPRPRCVGSRLGSERRSGMVAAVERLLRDRGWETCGQRPAPGGKA